MELTNYNVSYGGQCRRSEWVSRTDNNNVQSCTKQRGSGTLEVGAEGVNGLMVSVRQ